MDLVLITSPTTDEMELPFLNRMFRIGLKTLHLRKPDLSKNELRAYLDEIAKEFHHRIVLHDHFELAIEYDLKGIHFTEKGKDAFRDWRDYQGVKSWAVHDEMELLSLPREVDYVLLSPVFQSISKPDYEGNLNLDKAVDYMKSGKVPAKVYALGGISPDKFAELNSMQFDGAAILGSLWEQYKIAPENAYFHWEEIEEICQEL